MQFNILKPCLVTVYKHNFKETKEILVYRDDDYQIFGLLCEDTWSVIHIPSESVIVTGLYDRKEVFKYLEYLDQRIGLNNLLLCHADLNYIENNFQFDFKIAYKRILQKRSREKCEENNYFRSAHREQIL